MIAARSIQRRWGKFGTFARANLGKVLRLRFQAVTDHSPNRFFAWANQAIIDKYEAIVIPETAVCFSHAVPIPSAAMRNSYDQADVGRMIEHLSVGITSEFAADAPLNIIGVRTRGEILAARLATELLSRGYSKIGRGVLDITLYRDDLSEIGPRPLVRPTQLNIALDATPAILVDDVLFTGRSARAALNLLNDFGRPSVIRLAVLVDRGGRELPIQPDHVGLRLTDVPRTHRVKVRFTETDGADEVVVEPGK